MNGIAESLHSGIRTFCTLLSFSFSLSGSASTTKQRGGVHHTLFFSGARELVHSKRDFALKLQHQEIGE
jgi:hypothetical protein